ncbi:MAG: branched-chain amino acid ABC transporter substrate-binding protein [Cytophagales bacterium]|nr:branched-chain amino acid ABC transporter substrate-binding protein [Rhizobacter sp.]
MKFTKKMFGMSVSAVLALNASVAFAQAGETVKLAFIDPLSGPMANIGTNILHTFQFLAEKESGKGNPAGVKYEIVPFDNKGSPQESLSVLKAAADQGIRYIVQGNGSGAAAAISDAVSKHNERNPGKELVFLNYAAVDPDLTNSKCSYWHFRFDADTSMKMEAMTTYMKDDKSVKKVYIIGQNYAHGHQVAKFAKETLARKRPDVQIVGEDLHPIGQVKDFAPYIAKIKQSGADTVITGNWGNDMSLLFKAAKDAGLSINFYTYYAGATGSPAALGDYGLGKVKYVYGSYPNLPGEGITILQQFEAKYKGEDFSTATSVHLYKMLGAAIAKAKSTDPVKVAKAMEGLSVKSISGEVTMRAADHQLQQTLYLATWQKADKKNPIIRENTGNTWVAEKTFEPYVSSTPTTCQMKRPS